MLTAPPRAMVAPSRLLLLLGAAAATSAEEGEGPCPELLHGTGLHGAGPMKDAPRAGSVEECCMSALTALGGTWHCPPPTGVVARFCHLPVLPSLPIYSSTSSVQN